MRARIALLVALLSACAAPPAREAQCAPSRPEAPCPGDAVCREGACVVDLDPGEAKPDDLGDRWTEVWTLLDLNYGAFEAKPDLDWEAAFTETHEALEEVETLYEAEDVIARAVASIGDGHTYVQPDTLCEVDPGFVLGLSNTGACLVEAGGGFYVNQAIPESGLVVGDEVLGVDNRAVESLLVDLEAQPRCRRASSTEAQRRAELVASVMFRGPEDRFVTLRRGGRVITQPLGASRPARCTGRVTPAGASRDEVGVEVADLEGGVRYVHFPAFGADVGEGFQATPMAVALRAALEDTPAGGLILDLRGNGGGFTQITQLVVGALHDDEVELQTCQARGPDGVFSDEFVLTAQPDGALRYAGPVAVITDARTFSAGDFLAYALGARNGRATTVGAPSGGGFGNGFFNFAGGWLVGFNTLLCLDDGEPLEGAPPGVDVEAAHTPEALAAGEDAVIEAARLAITPL
jgi:C-terminal processing protease CtpA/Prc